MASGDTTTVIVEGGTREKRLAVAASMVCKVCCDEGSGSGAGSGGGGGGGGDVLCCGCSEALPNQVTATLNIACLGEITVTLNGGATCSDDEIADGGGYWEGSASQTSGSYGCIRESCVEGSIPELIPSTVDRSCTIRLTCTPCISNTTGQPVEYKWICLWHWFDYINCYFACGRSELTLQSCSPFLFEEYSSTLACEPTDALGCFGSSSQTEICPDGSTGATANLGSTISPDCEGDAFTINMSE